MAIADAINTIAAAQGGTPDKSGTIAGAIDALNDALAGSDQEKARTIEDAVVLLGEHIGGGGGGGSFGEAHMLVGGSEVEIVVATDSKLENIIGGCGLANPSAQTSAMARIPSACYFGITQGVAVMELVESTKTPVGPLASVGTASALSMMSGQTATFDVYLMPDTADRAYYFMPSA